MNCGWLSTPFMSFGDTIRIEILPRDETTSEIAIYSQSQVGYGDAGVNGKRVRRWLARLTDHES